MIAEQRLYVLVVLDLSFVTLVQSINARVAGERIPERIPENPRPSNIERYSARAAARPTNR
jgi:hypothetical protein